jgi:hypothetical protein
VFCNSHLEFMFVLCIVRLGYIYIYIYRIRLVYVQSPKPPVTIHFKQRNCHVFESGCHVLEQLGSDTWTSRSDKVNDMSFSILPNDR